MLVVCNLQSLAIVGRIYKVRYYKCRASFLDSISHIPYCHIEVGTLTIRFKAQYLTNNKKYMLLPFFGRYKLFNFISKKYHTYLIIVLYCRESQCCSYFGYHITFKNRSGTKAQTLRHINHQHYSKLTLLLKNLYIGFIIAGSNVPVDISQVITILILPHFRESHTSSLEG